MSTIDINTMTDEELEAFMETDDFWEEGSIDPKDLEEDPIEAITMLTFEEADAVRLSEKNFPTGKMGEYLFTVKSLWDNFANPKGMGETDSIIYHLEKVFPKVEAAHRKRPLGEFKDLIHLSHSEIYSELIDRVHEPHESKDRGTMSFLEVIWEYGNELMRKHMAKSDWLSQTQFFMGLSMMLFQSSIGIFLEGEVSRKLEHEMATSKLGKRFRYEEAPFTMEREDVDGVVIDSETGKVVCCISIKTMNALSQKTVDRYRKPRSQGGKGKTKPDIYCGWTSLNSFKRGDELSWIRVDGLSLRDILKAAVSS